MKFVLSGLGIIIPIMMMIMGGVSQKIRLFFDVAAVLCSFIFSNIAALTVYDIIRDRTVFETHVHAVFLDPLFLMSGSYLGTYFIYRLLARTNKVFKA